MTRLFQMSDIEKADADEWLKEHDKTCPIVNGDTCATIGGRVSYIFTPTGLGVGCSIQCACGQSKECTDVRCW